mmetsp:Transcript_9858/g.24612  ORF Transcript_9858/g.24612 Transcript_9858/m.24612 type:complete len:460 (-) Transcript_9858:449-1828(-)
MSGERWIAGSSGSVAGSASGANTRSVLGNPMACRSRTLRTRWSQHRHDVAPVAPDPSSGAFMPRAAGDQSRSRSSTSARMARTCTLNSLNSVRSSFSASAALTRSLMALRPLRMAPSREASRAPCRPSSAATSSRSALSPSALTMSPRRPASRPSSASACAASSASRSTASTTSARLALASFSSSTRSSMAPMDLMMLSARLSAWSMARATPALTSSTVSAASLSCFLLSSSSSRSCTAARLLCSGVIAAATCVLNDSSLDSSATTCRRASSSRAPTSAAASFMSSTSCSVDTWLVSASVSRWLSEFSTWRIWSQMLFTCASSFDAASRRSSMPFFSSISRRVTFSTIPSSCSRVTAPPASSFSTIACAWRAAPCVSAMTPDTPSTSVLSLSMRALISWPSSLTCHSASARRSMVPILSFTVVNSWITQLSLAALMPPEPAACPLGSCMGKPGPCCPVL